MTTNAAVLLTLTTAGERLGVGRSTIYRLLGDGSLPSVRIGRRRLIPVAAIDAFVADLAGDLTSQAAGGPDAA